MALLNQTQLESFKTKKEELTCNFVYDRHKEVTSGDKIRIRIDGTVDTKSVVFFVSPKFKLPNLVNGQTYKAAFIEVEGTGNHAGRKFTNIVSISEVLTDVQRDIKVTGASVTLKVTPVLE